MDMPAAANAVVTSAMMPETNVYHVRIQIVKLACKSGVRWHKSSTEADSQKSYNTLKYLMVETSISQSTMHTGKRCGSNWYFKKKTKKSIPLRSMQTTENHWMECPSIWCQEAIFWVCQLSKPGRISLYLVFNRTIWPAWFPGSSNSSLPFKPTCLLCFPLTLGVQMLPLPLGWSPPEDEAPTPFTNVFPGNGLKLFKPFNGSSDSLSPSESATKSLTASVVISTAESAACSLRNYNIQYDHS